MKKVTTTQQAVDQLIKSVGNNIVMATPLGVGKPNPFLNELYQAVKRDPKLQLTLLTALTLQIPQGKNFLERKFLEPFSKRVFGDYPNFDYENDRILDSLPDNVKIVEFYFQAGKYINLSGPQRNYLSSNYTHVVRDLVDRGVNCICQQIIGGKIDGQSVYSLSCNPDLTIDLAELCAQNKRPLFKVGQTNSDLPFMYGESIVEENFFHLVIDNKKYDFPVFAPPKMAVSQADFMIGLHASTLIKDDGEIQIGIGSLADALVHALCLRQNNNKTYRSVLNELNIDCDSFPILTKWGDTRPFDKGLFAATEMLVDSFSELYKCKILKKKVFDSVVLQRLLNQGLIEEEIAPGLLQLLVNNKAISSLLTENDFDFLKDFGIIKKEAVYSEGYLTLKDQSVKPNLLDPACLEIIESHFLGDTLRNGAVAHGGFFLGPRSFYDFLKNLPVAERKLFRMKRISQINQLYGHEEIDRLQRTNGRFVNTCMKVTLNGSACSDVLENGTQISGVGGQYNFVAMAHELPDARSILQLRSCRKNSKGRWESNILFNYGNCTIPRHLRDIVITEYGIADLRGRTDEEVAIALIQIADSRFQDKLIQQSVRAKKLSPQFKLEEKFKGNCSAKYSAFFEKHQNKNLFDSFPFGTDFTPEEIQLGKSLKKLNEKSQKFWKIIPYTLAALLASPPNSHESKLLKRLDLSPPNHWKYRIFKKLVTRSLR